jgi:MYXO-CTERM domain-containing protein
MVIQRARGLDKLSVYLVYRPSHVLVPPFVLLALAALWVVRRRRAAAAPEPSQATGLSELQFQMQGLVTALDHLYRTLAVADVLAYGHARRLDEHVVADFLNNERSILELEKRMTAEELDAVVTARVYLMLGNVQFLRGDHEAAKKRYEHGLRLDKGSAALWNDLGLAFHHMGDHERAEKCLRKAQELAPDDQTVLLNLGRLFGAKAHLARAATWQAPYGAVPAAMRARSLSWDYGRASKMASWGSPPAWKEASLEREQAAFYDQQEEVYARVLERDPDNLEALVGLGMALRHKGAPDRSLQLLERAAALAPQNGAILYELARLYDAKGDTKRAVEHYRRCRDALHMR